MKKLYWIGGVFIALVFSIIGGMYYFLTTTVPEYNGKIIAETIADEVEIIRDSYGMPHIYASNDADAAFAFGYCSAQDRLFQMEMIRRAIKGRLSEVLGSETVEIDRLFRMLTSEQSTKEIYGYLSDELKSIMNAYAGGVNYYLSHHKENLPFEFSLLGFEPEPWQPSDGLTVLYHMAWGLNFSFNTELTYATIRKKIGDKLASEIYIDYPQGGPIILPDNISLSGANRLAETIQAARLLTGMPVRGASNNWVISGEKSNTGAPLLANDMHLGLGVPGIWYEAHIHTPNHNVSGVVLPGVPFIVAGANDYIAWGFTNVMADDADYYIEKINPDNRNQYEYLGNWEDMIIRQDTIYLSNESSDIFQIRQTRHGVIIDEIIDEPLNIPPRENYAIAMKWSISDFHDELSALYHINRAKDIDEIEQAAKLFKCPGQNWVYADDAGNIGYWAAVGIPIRDGFDGQSLLSGWDGEHEWSGYVESDNQPHYRNPESGIIATANNKIAGENYPNYISHCYGPPDRIERILSMLNENEKIGIDDFRRMQADDYMIMAEIVVPRLIKSLEDCELSELEKQSLEYLMEWNFRASKESVSSSIYHSFWQFVIENIFRERLGDDLYFSFILNNNFTVHKAIRNLIKSDSSEWFDNPNTPTREDLNIVLANSFKMGVEFLANSYGNSIDNWHWDKMHPLTFYSSIGRRLPILNNWMSIGPFAMGGSTHSVNPTIFNLGNPWQVMAGASQRHIFDLGNMKNSLRVIPCGISGNFMSHHYDDQIELWLNVEYRPFHLDKEDVEKDAAYKMTISPVSKEK